MREYKQYILWDRITKIPVDYRTGSSGSINDRKMWMSYDHAKSLSNEKLGFGFVLTAEDPFFFLDIDKCIGREGVYNEVSTELIKNFRGAYYEISQSKRGIHIIAKSDKIQHKCRNSKFRLELYTESRYVALTETNVVGNPNLDFTKELGSVVGQYFSGSKDNVKLEDWPLDVRASNVIVDDSVLLARAMSSKQGSGRASFKEIWEGEALDSYAGNASAVDAALAQHLAFWTGGDCERMLSLMLQSHCRREKWGRDDYLKRTIMSAVLKQNDFYTVDKTTFKDCTYVIKQHEVFVPDHGVVNPHTFRALFGGKTYPMSSDGEKTTRNAWLAFSESEAFSKKMIADVCFEPRSVYGEIVEGCINVYKRGGVARSRGDVSLFLKHLELILPDSRDRKILISYMSACVQFVGTKFQWAPVLQGVEGNGKTLISRCLMHAVGREYTSFPRADELASRFNGWLDKKLLVCVEDIYVPGFKNRIIEMLKPMITGGDAYEIQKKGQDQFTAKIYANFILNTNHKDGLRKTTNDRRFCMLYNAQQSVDDLIHDGMDSNYFNKLYGWLDGGGYNHIAEYLSVFRIEDEFNPCVGATRAPHTSTTEEAIRESIGYIEQEILEAVEFGRYGFRGGFISSFALSRLLDELKVSRKIHANQRKVLLEGIGYIVHPALREGRLNKVVIEEGGKPIIYIKKGLKLGANPDEIYNLYNKLQH